MKLLDQYRQSIQQIEYCFEFWTDYDYSILSKIRTVRSAGRSNKTYNDIIIMGDTESSKKDKTAIWHNHVVAWTISLRACNHNICTLWGQKPDDMISCIDKMQDNFKAETTFIYFHNLPYDWIFLRKFMFEKWNNPEKQLNIKSHYPINIVFSNGIILKDSLILAQRSLDKWSRDLNVDHQKAVGKWDYDKIRNQSDDLTVNELKYIEHDTLAGVECIDATMQTLNKHIYSLPYTATGIPREGVRKAGKSYQAHQHFVEQALTYDELQIAEKVYHGGYTHANRHFLNCTINGTIKCYDFASSYPYIMISHKFPIERFTKYDNCTMSEILDIKNKYAFMFKLIAVGVKLKDDSIAMPVLQMSRTVKNINAITDNGRILSCEYVEIYLTEIDLQLIVDQYDIERHLCIEVYAAKKGFLPHWFTNYVYQSFVNKTQYKGGDAVLYSISKALLNSLYGMCCQHPVKPDIVEHYSTGEYETLTSQNMLEEYEKFCNRLTTILPYQWGIWVTAYAMYNLHQLGKCCKKWLYSDTDSVYGIDWNIKAVEQYNAHCKQMLKDNGYGAVIHNGREYWLGVAEHDPESDVYTQFRTVGSKRYCGRNKADGQLHITVAGVPKKGASELNDNIDNFTTGLIFRGSVTGKKTHTYFYPEAIYTDNKGNITGDSIDLSECDYLLQSEKMISWEDILYDEEAINNYELL